jgi:large conductance mechanosensitive channel
MLDEFRKFVMRGNVLDLAVGVIIGGAFGAIVSSLVNDIIMPLVGVLTGGINFAELALTVGSAEVKYGSFIQAIVNFLIIAFVLFMIIKAANSMKKEAPPAPAAPPPPSKEEVLLTEIRDLVKQQTK